MFTESLEQSLVQNDAKHFNYVLRVAKRIAYECPIVHISDTFYILLRRYANKSLSETSVREDIISRFFGAHMCPKIINIPIQVQ